MKPKTLAIYFCVALLPSIIYGQDKTIREYADDVEIIAAGPRLINGVFKPRPDGFKGNGSYAFVHIGFMYPNDKYIAMKFTLPSAARWARDEYRMFSYLNAINSTVCENYGVPALYYFGEWEETGLILTGFTVLEESIGHLAKNGQLLQHDVNVLIVLRDFILSSKYMHKHGVRHDDINLDNMMVRKHRTFLIDLNCGSIMARRSWSGTHRFASREYHSDGRRFAIDDFESFIYSICAIIPGVKFDWMEKEPGKMLKYKKDTKTTIKRLKKIKSPKLQEIFVRLAEHIFIDCENKKYPDYDVFYNLVDKAIHSYGLEEPVMFTWLKNEARADAIADLNEYPTPNIAELFVPSNYNEYPINYVEPDLKLFTDAYADWLNLQD